jgi:hypothetical protein
MAQKSLPEMLLELGRMPLPETTRAYIDQMRLLMEEGMDDAINIAQVRGIYAKAAASGLRVVPSPAPQGLPLPPFGQMIAELDEAQAAIVNDADREFIQGILMLLSMQEAIAQSDAQRVQKVYVRFRQVMHQAEMIRD